MNTNKEIEKVIINIISMNDKLNNSLRKEHMIQMSNISLDDSFNLERLKTFSSQNFTAILNNPIPQVY